MLRLEGLISNLRFFLKENAHKVTLRFPVTWKTESFFFFRDVQTPSGTRAVTKIIRRQRTFPVTKRHEHKAAF